MLIIVMSHYMFHGINQTYSEISFQSIFKVLFTGGGVGVICFVCISAYFLVDVDTIKVKKVFLLWASLFVYSITIGVVAYCVNPEIGIMSVIECALPVTFSKWWFATAYLILYIFVPYINKFIKSLTKKDLRNLLITMTILWMVLPTISNKDYLANDLIRFVYLYLIVAYIKVYPVQNEAKKGIFLFGIGFGVVLCSIIVFQIAGNFIPRIYTLSGYFQIWTKIPNLMEGIGLFLIFKNIKLKPNKMVNTVAASTFNVYLFHDHPLMRDILWEKLLKVNDYVGRSTFLIHFVFSVIIVFGVGTAIGWIYKHTIEKLFALMYDKVFDGLSKRSISRIKR